MDQSPPGAPPPPPPPPPPIPLYSAQVRSEEPDEEILIAREEAANEAIAKAAVHVAMEYIRQDVAEALGEDDATKDEMLRDGLHFASGSFRYNKRVGALLAMAAVAILPVLGSATFVVLICACVATYISDFLNYRKGTIAVILSALLCMWISMFTTNTVDLTQSADAMLLIVSISALLSVVAGWCVLQFHWVQIALPELACCLERMVLGLSPIASLPSLFALIIATIGARNAPLPFAVVLCVLHHTFYRRLRSSFLHTANPTRKQECYATGSEEAMAFAAITVFAPSIAYLSLNFSWDLSSDTGDLTFHFFNFLGLIAVPVAYFAWFLKSACWFLYPLHSKPESLSEAMAQTADTPRPLIVKVRLYLFLVAYPCLLHALIYRLLRSRYAYLFAGVPMMLSEIYLTTAVYMYTIAAALIIRLQRPFPTAMTKTVCWTSLILLSSFATILVGICAGTPGFFLPLSGLSVATFCTFIIDPKQANTFMMFLFSSMLVLLWWMYHTFSFIHQELHVLGESAAISTQAIAVSVLWAYILGALAFACSLTKSTGMLITVLILHGLKVTWVEHVLYSQRDKGAYPPPFVVLTTALGIFLGYRLYKNGVLGNETAAAVSALYVGKLFSWMYDVCTWRYTDLEFAGDQTAHFVFHIIESALTYWCSSCAFWLICVTEKTRLQMTTLFAYFAVAAACQHNALVRFVLEFLFQSVEPGPFRKAGGVLLLFSAAAWPLCHFPTGKGTTNFPVFGKITSLAFSIGVVLLIVDPSLEYVVGGSEMDETDIPIRISLGARLSAVISVALLGLGRFVPFVKIPRYFRMIYWMAVAAFAAYATVGPIIPVADTRVVLSLIMFFILIAMVVELAHYTRAESIVHWIVYACAIGSMAMCYVALNHVDLLAITKIDVYIWELHTTGRHGLLAVSAIVNLALAIVLKFRLSGRSLLPHPVPLTPHIVQHVGLICNYSTLLAYVILAMLNNSIGDGHLGSYVLSASFLLLLHDDDILFLELSRGNFRYLPPFIGAILPLWCTLAIEAFSIAQIPLTRRIWHLVTAFPVVPSQISLLMLLYFGAKRAGTPKGLLTIFGTLDLIALLVHTSPSVQWMALANLVAHACRIFGAEAWKQRSGPLL
jgi:hypothetical protein